MEKLKNIVSPSHSGQRKSTDAADSQHTPSSTATSSSVPAAKAQGEHPIYDQFTGHASGEPAKTDDYATRDLNTAQVGSGTTGTTGARTESSLRADTAGRPQTLGGDPSSASIKSGVIGFPQGNSDSHAALGNDHPAEQALGSNQIVGGGNALGTNTIDSKPSHAARDTALGAGTSGLAANELTRKHEDSSHGATRTAERHPQEKPLGEQSGTAHAERTFPLAGGVATNRSVGNTTTSEREPGTKDKDIGVHDGHGREALAGAAAAATTSSALPHREQQGPTNPQGTTSGGHTHPDALAAATVAASKDHSTSPNAQGQAEAEKRRSGLLFTTGPHITDTANMFDPHLHVPGEFPSPTPVEDQSAGSYLESKGTSSGATGAQHELRHTGALNEPQTRSTDQSSGDHHGRDAAIAGGLGAAGAGAYAAGKHHQHDTAQVGGETFPTEKSPYSSSKIDPRVDSRPHGFSEQRFDPTASTKHQGQDATLPGAVTGTPGLTGNQTSQPRGAQENLPPTTSQPLSQPRNEKSEHHYGRDAALVGAGAGAATTAGLYANQRQNEPDSGPASSTVGPHKSNAANIIDPRVQPDPALQKKHHAAPTAEDPAPSTVGPHKSDAANVLDPRVLPDPQKQKAAPKEEHHYGRDAAVAGGTGAAGYGAYEAAKSHGDHRSAQPDTALTGQRNDPSVSNPAVSQRTEDPIQQSQHHHGRDAAIAGGTGAAGYGAYEAVKAHGDHGSAQPGAALTEQRYDPSAAGPTTTGTTQRTEDPTQKSQHHYGRDAAAAGALGGVGAGAYGATRHHDQSQQPPVSQQQNLASQQAPTTSQGQHDAAQDPNKQHQKRDAAALGAAGAAAGAGGAYAYSQHDAEKERQAAQKAHEQQLKDQQKDFEKKQKEQEKAYHDQQKKAEHEHAKDEKHHNKLVAAEEKKHEKEAEREQKHLEKERQKEDQAKEEDGKKKHGLFGFLHRDKKDKDKTSGENSPRGSTDDPRHSKEYAGVGAAAGVAGGAAAYEATHEDKDGRNRLHKDPPPGHPAREALEEHPQGQHGLGKREHIGTDGPIGDANKISGDHGTRAGTHGAAESGAQHHTVIEPHTGLPMNVEKYGDGRGGTDGSSTIGGYHQVTGQPGGHKGNVTDWEAIKKADTPY